MSAAITRHLDVTGTFCPLPILLAAREMLRLAAGDRLEIVGDDPAILEDIPVWCQRAGHRLVEISERQGKIVSVLEKGDAATMAPGRRRRGGSGGAGGAGGRSAGGAGASGAGGTGSTRGSSGTGGTGRLGGTGGARGKRRPARRQL